MRRDTTEAQQNEFRMGRYGRGRWGGGEEENVVRPERGLGYEGLPVARIGCCWGSREGGFGVVGAQGGWKVGSGVHRDPGVQFELCGDFRKGLGGKGYGGLGGV